MLGRIRAGVLEQVTIDLLDECGVERAHAPARAWCTTASSCSSRARGTASTCHGLTGGKTVTVYGQTEVTHDLMDARKAEGLTTDLRGGDSVTLHDFDGAQPKVRYVKDGQAHEIECDFIAGCDGYHGVSRASVPAGALKTYEKVYPFGWLGVLADVPPVSPRADLRQHRARLRAVLHAQPHAQPLLRAGAAPTRRWRTGGRGASGTSCAAAWTREAREHLVTGPSHRKKHRAAAQLRRRADALRPAVPGRRRRPHRAADRRQGPEPGGLRREVPVVGA